MASLGPYNVFLSFRGDTRHTFTDHLYKALMGAGISTFRDKEDFKRGEKLEEEIERIIKESSASVVVISEEYATSTWCLDELALILQQRKECNHYVIPVFYHVDSSDVKKQNKKFAIKVEEGSLRMTDDNVKLWKKALTEVPSLGGYVLKEGEYETEYLKKIINDIYNKLDCKEVHLPCNITGMDSRYGEVSSWLNQPDVEFLAIWGMGGSGKTTLAKHIYNLNWRTYENRIFVEDINNISKTPNGMRVLQEQLLKRILGGKKVEITSVQEGTKKIEEALQTKRSLIVLDGITEDSQLVDLIGNEKINAESKIIITTIRKKIGKWLKSKNWRFQKYKMELLKDDEASELLSRHAFDSKSPKEGYEELIDQAVKYCGGNPLALEVLGSSLSDLKNIPEWESELKLPEDDIHLRINNVLLVSYNLLPFVSQKDVFLHIACFFVGIDMDYVVKILEHDYRASFGIKSLSNRCLLSVSPNKKLMMHRLLQAMGKKIVRQESEEIVENRSRVWRNRDSYKILRSRMGSKTIKGLALDMQMLKDENFAVKSSPLTTDALQKMDKLKLLQLKFVQLDGFYGNISEDLRWLCWVGSHLTTIPSDLFMGNLVAIDMSYSSLEVFKPPMILQSLQILNLKDSHNLIEILNMSMIPRLETLILWGCPSLVSVCETMGELTNLTLLNMTGCNSLFNSKQTDLFSGLEASIAGGKVTIAEQRTFSFPRSLHRLFLKDCNIDRSEDFPPSFSDQPSLEYLNIGNGLFQELPSFEHLNNLRVLDLSLCAMLKQLVCLPKTLAELYVYDCISLEKISFQSHRYTLQEFGYEGCTRLSEVEGFIKLVHIAKLEENDLGHMKWLKQYQNREVCLVGDNKLTKGRSPCVQMLYEFNIMSTSLPDIKDLNIKPTYVSKLKASFLLFTVPPCPKNRRLKGLDVTFKYTISSDDYWVWGCKICTTNKRVNLMYSPKVFGKPEYGKDGIWLSYWPIGNTLHTEDEVSVSINVIGGLKVHECGVSLVYTDDGVAEETLEDNMTLVEALEEDLSGFKLTTGAYYLCRRDFYELMEVGKLAPDWLSILVGDTIECTEVRGWRKTGRPMQINPSFTELKFVRCIMHGPESEEIYKIAEMSKSPYVDKTQTLEFTSSLLEETMKPSTSSKSSETTVKIKPLQMASLLSESISKLSTLVMHVAKTTANFKPELKLLSVTLERIRGIIVDIGSMDLELHRSEEECKMFIDEIKEAAKLVAKCSKVKWNFYKKFTYSLKLKDFNGKLLRFFQIEVQAIQTSDIMDTLKAVNDLKLKEESVSSMSTPRITHKSGYENMEREKYGWRIPALPSGIVAFGEPLLRLKTEVVAEIDSDDRSVLVVTGVGGCGKTTLVKMLCHDPEIREIFGENIFFVTVSETFSFMVIVNDLLNSNSSSIQSNVDAKNELENFLNEKVSGPMLLVLDDVWSNSFIKNFPSEKRGCKILVTSRTALPNYNVFGFDPLNEKDAKTLFCRSAFTKGGKIPSPIIDEDLVNQMVRCCNRHPLTLGVVGRSLNGKGESNWRSMLNSLSKDNPVLDLHKDVLTRLEISFEAFDNEFKQCFLDFGLFPEDQRIHVSALLNIWVHLYNHDDDGVDTLSKIFELSHKNLVDIITTGFKKDSGARVNHCDQQFVTQHDLLRELAIHLNNKLPLEKRSRLIINAQGEDLPAYIKHVQEAMEARILSISTGELFSSQWCDMNIPDLEVLILNLMSKTYTLPQFLPGMQKLKILSITNNGLHPTEFENFHLLGSSHNLTRIRFERVIINSSILSLENLQKVSFIMCTFKNTFEEVIPNIWPQLVEIEIDYCHDLVEFPGVLCNSVHLKKISITNCNEMCLLSENFGNLTDLETLSLRSCTKLEKLPESIWKLEKLSVVDISDCLSLSGLPEKMGKLGGLRTIYMKRCTGLNELPESVEELSSVRVVCDAEIAHLWQEYSNVEIHLVEEDRLETLTRII